MKKTIITIQLGFILFGSLSLIFDTNAATALLNPPIINGSFEDQVIQSNESDSDIVDWNDASKGPHIIWENYGVNYSNTKSGDNWAKLSKDKFNYQQSSTWSKNTTYDNSFVLEAMLGQAFRDTVVSQFEGGNPDQAEDKVSLDSIDAVEIANSGLPLLSSTAPGKPDESVTHSTGTWQNTSDDLYLMIQEGGESDVTLVDDGVINDQGVVNTPPEFVNNNPNIIIKQVSSSVSQGVAVDATYYYEISDTKIIKKRRSDDSSVVIWEPDTSIPAYAHFTHMNSATVVSDKLYVAHSRYGEDPNDNTIEVFNISGTRLTHVKSIPLPRIYGSCTWADFYDDYWWICYAVYGSPENRDTRLVKYEFVNGDFIDTGKNWYFPSEAIDKWGTFSCSGGSWGPDGLLYTTGHGGPECYVLKVPASGYVMEYVRTETDIGVDGQGISWDRTSVDPVLWAIYKKAFVFATHIFSDEIYTGLDGMESVSYSDTVAGLAIDVDGDALTYFKNTGPAWLVVNADGVLSGTPSSSDVGTNVFVIGVSDGNGGSDLMTLNINIDGAVSSGLFNPPLKNAGFEDPVVGLSASSNDVKFWYEKVSYSFTKHADVNSPVYPAAAEGDNWSEFAQNRYLYQQVGVWTAETSYTVSFMVGKRSNRNLSSVTVNLWVGGDPLLAADDVDLDEVGATEVDTSTAILPAIFGMGSSAETVTLSTGTGFTEGEPLWLRFLIGDGGSGSRTLLDNINISH